MELAYKKQGFILFKLIPCLIITMFAFMCLYGSNVYASIDYTYNNENFPFPDLPTDNIVPNYYYICYDDASWLPNHYFLICSENEMTVSTIDSDFGRIVSSSTVYVYVYISDTNTWSSYSTVKSSDQVRQGHPKRIRYSSYDIYNKNGELVFQVPPQVQGTQAIIAEQVEEVEMNKTLQEILGILPVVIVVLVGLIAIRKGIIFLIARMKKA